MSDPQHPTDETPENKVHPRESQARKSEHADPSCRSQSEYLSALHQTAVALIDRLDRKELLQTILERVTTLVGTDHGYVYLVNSDQREMEMRVGKGFFAGQLGLRVKRGEGLGGTVWVSERPVLVDDYHSWTGRIPKNVHSAPQNRESGPI